MGESGHPSDDDMGGVFAMRGQVSVVWPESGGIWGTVRRAPMRFWFGQGRNGSRMGVICSVGDMPGAFAMNERTGKAVR